MVVVLSIGFVTLAAYSIVAPFIVFELKRKSVGEHYNGLIFVMYPIATAVASPQVPNIITHFGMNKAVSIGMCTMGATLIIFGLLAFI